MKKQEIIEGGLLKHIEAMIEEVGEKRKAVKNKMSLTKGQLADEIEEDARLAEQEMHLENTLKILRGEIE